MPSGLILAIDQGTTNTKALLVEQTGEPVFRASCPVALVHRSSRPRGTGSDALWDSVVQGNCRVRIRRQKGDTIDAIAISNQRETAVAWDAETGKPIAPRRQLAVRTFGGNL